MSDVAAPTSLAESLDALPRVEAFLLHSPNREALVGVAKAPIWESHRQVGAWLASSACPAGTKPRSLEIRQQASRATPVFRVLKAICRIQGLSADGFAVVHSGGLR